MNKRSVTQVPDAGWVFPASHKAKRKRFVAQLSRLSPRYTAAETWGESLKTNFRFFPTRNAATRWLEGKQ